MSLTVVLFASMAHRSNLNEARVTECAICDETLRLIDIFIINCADFVLAKRSTRHLPTLTPTYVQSTCKGLATDNNSWTNRLFRVK
jgi:hypothetical protein